MSSFEDLIAKAKAQTHALRATLNELATVPIEAPTHDVPEIARALAGLHAIRNGYRLTEVVDPTMKDFMEGKVEGIECAIEALEGRGTTKRPRARATTPQPIASHAPIPAELGRTGIAHQTPKPPVPKSIAAPTADGLGKGKFAVLAAIGQTAFHGATLPHISLLTTYKRRSIENYVGMLKSDHLILIDKADEKYMVSKAGLRELARLGFVAKATLELLSKGERLVLESIVRGQKHGVTKAMLMLDTPYKRRSVDNYVTSLGTRELVEGDKRIHLTKQGEDACADLEVGPLVLTEGEDVIFEAITMSRNGISKGELCAILDGQYKRRSIENYLGMLTTRELVEIASGKYIRRKD